MTWFATQRDDDQLEGSLGKAVEAVCSETVSQDVIERVQTNALQLEHETTQSHMQRGHRKNVMSTRRVLMLATGVALLLGVILLWTSPSRSLLAEVVQAAQQQTWVHFDGRGPNGVVVKSWYSPKHRIFATRQGDEVMFVDIAKKTVEACSAGNGESQLLTRLPLSPEQAKQFSSSEQMLVAMFFGNPLTAFDGSEQELLSHTSKNIREGERQLIEYRFTTKQPDVDEQTVTVLRIDSESHLPLRLEVTFGNELVLSCKISFPEQGPRSIYAMGVPPDIEVVDQTPSHDLEKIFAAWKTGRTEFDDYRAVVVESTSADHRSRGRMVYLVRNTKDKWRVDQLRMPMWHGESPRLDEVPDGVDPHSWWLERGTEWEAIPKSVSDGSIEVRVKPVFVEPHQEDPKNPRYRWISSFEAHRGRAFNTSDSDPRPNDRRVMPEFQVYPSLRGEGVWGFQNLIRPDLLDGPRGTVLIESIDQSPPQAQGKSLGARYWADPTRGYAVKQMQWLTTGESPDPMQGRIEMQNLTLSPSGFWYPVVVREFQNSMSMETGERSDTFLRFYVDFEVDLPDELFDVQQWGPIK